MGDIYYVLFRHKWKIIICSLLGILGGLALYKSETPPYQSEAKLFVRYILSENKSSGPPSDATSKLVPDERGANIMNTEVEILNSLDLSKEVAAAVGPERILAKVGGGNDLGAATGMVRGGLSVGVGAASSVIHIVFRHPDPDIVQVVLREVIERYLKLHVEAHRAAGMLGESLAQEADTLRSRLALTEDELRKATNDAGIVSLEAAKEDITRQMSAIRRELLTYETELAGRLAVFEDIKKRTTVPTSEAKPDDGSELSAEVIDEYRILSNRIARLHQQEQELLLSFKADAPRVKDVHEQLVSVQLEFQKLRDKHPKLTRLTTPLEPQRGPDPEAAEAATAWHQITAFQAKIKELTSQLEKTRDEASKLDRKESRILDLRRQKELQEQHYRYYAATLEQTRIRETLGNGKVSNITQIQAPSPPYTDRINRKKVGMTIAGGILGGIFWAFLIELYLDRSIRRPIDLQRHLRAPLFLSIPQLKGAAAALKESSIPLLSVNGSDSKSTAGVNGALHAGNEATGPLRPFHETLRDRLIGYFENRNLIHKPKLVAVTSLRPDAGVTSTATGLARSLSETGEGNVLLVDMTASQGSAQQFTKGKATCGLDELLEARTQAHVHENLYVVTESSNSERLSRNLPQRFAKLIPKLKASDFDYIIFDMPTVNQLSITPRLAGFMDMVLLVIESEKTDRELVQGACALLAESKAHVGVVLNKTRNYVPERLQQQLTSS